MKMQNRCLNFYPDLFKNNYSPEEHTVFGFFGRNKASINTSLQHRSNKQQLTIQKQSKVK